MRRMIKNAARIENLDTDALGKITQGTNIIEIDSNVAIDGFGYIGSLNTDQIQANEEEAIVVESPIVFNDDVEFENFGLYAYTFDFADVGHFKDDDFATSEYGSNITFLSNDSTLNGKTISEALLAHENFVVTAGVVEDSNGNNVPIMSIETDAQDNVVLHTIGYEGYNHAVINNGQDHSYCTLLFKVL